MLEFEGCPVVVVNVQGAPVREKPVYVKKLGLANGSYVRTGDGDHKMSRYEIDRSIGASDEDLMANRRVVAADDEGVLRPTLAGLLALGRYPQMFYPRLNIVFTSYPSSRKGEPGASGARFVDTVNIEGPIPEMVVNAVRAVSRNQFLARILEDVPYTDFDGRTGRVVENRGSGYPTIDRELKAASLESPIVDSTLDGFVFEIRNTKLAEGDPQGRVDMAAEAAILEYLSKRDSASTAEIALALGVSSKTARMRLNALIDEGVVEAIGAKTSPKRAYRLPR